MTKRSTLRSNSPELSGKRLNEEGSALLLAMIMILILTLLGFGLLTRTLLVSEMAGAERWTTQAFFAADAGIEIAKKRVIINGDAFTFDAQDLRGSGAAPHQAGLITVSVSSFTLDSRPTAELGGSTGGGQGSGTSSQVKQGFRGTSTAVANRTKSEARIRATLTVRPMVPRIDY